MAFYTGTNRSASKILKEQQENTLAGGRRVENLRKMVDLTFDMRRELVEGDIDCMGEILHTSWNYKKELASGISNDGVDEYYALAMKHGALGGKLLGAGGGGFLLFYVKEYNQPAVRQALKGLKELDFHFDSEGTSIIYYE